MVPTELGLSCQHGKIMILAIQSIVLLDKSVKEQCPSPTESVIEWTRGQGTNETTEDNDTGNPTLDVARSRSRIMFQVKSSNEVWHLLSHNIISELFCLLRSIHLFHLQPKCQICYWC